MKYAVLLLTLVSLALLAQTPDKIRLPSGKTWQEELIAHNYEENVKDSKKLVELSQEIASDFEQGDKYLFSLKTRKKLEQAEKLAKEIRERMERN